MATDALTPCLPGPSGQVFVRCLQIPALKIKSKTTGDGPGQERGGGAQTNVDRGGAIRARAGLVALKRERITLKRGKKLLRGTKGRN